MTVTEFRRLIDTFGTDRMRWPEHQLRAAEALLADSAEARAALDRATELDARLLAQPIALPTARRAQVVDAAVARIATATARHPARNWYRICLAAFIPPAPAALALLALIGCQIGLSVPLPKPQPSEPLVAELSVLLMGDTDEPL